MKKRTLIFLRFILILVTILVMIYSKKGMHFPEPGYIIGVIYFLSNILLYRIPERILDKSLVLFLIFSFDIVAISLGVYFTQGIQTDFYLIYFLVIFVASVGQNISGSLPTAIIASVIYGWMLYQTTPGISFLDSRILIRIPFLFIISLMSSYWSQATRRALKEKEELEKFNRELQKEVSRVAAEEIELRKYNEKIINTVGSGVMVVNSWGIITTLNPEAARSLNLKKEDAVNTDIKTMSNLKVLWPKINECIRTEKPLSRDEITITTAGNKKVTIGFSLSPICGAKDRFSGCTMIFKDLSEIRDLEAKLKHAERLSYLGKMASWVAHEIRNPLTSIDGFAQLLETTEDKDKIKSFSSEIRKGAQRINNIVGDILAFARTKRKSALVSINLKDLARSIARNDTGTKIIIAEDTIPVVEGDFESIRRLFVNLIDNAIEAMKDSGTLDISFSNEGDYWLTEIKDTGIGIAEEDISNIFEPFFTTKQRGTGLGLAIVKKIVEEHKGKINVISKPGIGTTMMVYLPKKQITD